MDWQPIESAPVDGTHLLLYGQTIVDDDGKPDDGRRLAVKRCIGWWADGRWDTDDHCVYCEPTHWMPLPAPPKEMNDE